MKRHRLMMLGVLVLGLGGVWMAGACDSVPIDSGTTRPGDQPTECPAEVEEPCMRYRIPLVGNPSMDLVLRGKYIVAFGTACYMSEANTFDCYYKTWKKACEDAVKIGEVSGNAPYGKGYTCQAVGNGDYTLQIGPDVANKLTVYYQAAPRQTPLIDVNGLPTAVNGPYRNLPEPQDLAPGNDFYKKSPDKSGNLVVQHDLILKVNRDAHGGEIHSDLAGFEYPCNGPTRPMCKEPLVLIEGSPNDADAAQVHHVVRRKDERCCPWGTNSSTNAAVISRKLNRYFTNKHPSVDEVNWVNNVPPYMP